MVPLRQSTTPPFAKILSSLAAVLLIAAHVLGDIDRWWARQGRHLSDGPELGDVYRLLHTISVEAEAAWSLLVERGDGTRIFSVHTAALQISLLLIERHDDIIVWDIRIPTQL